MNTYGTTVGVIRKLLSLQMVGATGLEPVTSCV
jgi:hypothetical protein